jgi:hypothetical protein
MIKGTEIDTTDMKHVEKMEENHDSKKGTKKETEEKPKKRKPEIPFWTESPGILIDNAYLMEFFPTEQMTYYQKLNAISRAIIVLMIITLIITRTMRPVIVSAITLFAIYILYYYHSKDEKEKDRKKRASLEAIENFEVSKPVEDYFKHNNVTIPDDLFDKPTSTNPYSNVLNSDIQYNPNKKPAPPAFNYDVNNQILKQAKQLVVEANPDQPDIADKLFKDLGDQYVFEQSLRPFNTAASSTIPNDQAAFAEFCYGSMISCKEGNQFACARNLSRHANY